MQLMAAQWTAQENKDLVVAYANNRTFLLIQLYLIECLLAWLIFWLYFHPSNSCRFDRSADKSSEV